MTLQATVATALGAPGGSQLTVSRDACGPGGTALATRSVNSTTGVATWTTKNLPLGTYQLYACFVATGTYAGSQGGPINQTVTPRR